MKIFRGPQTTDDFDETDSKQFSELPDDWTPSDIIWFDGTKDKSGTRHTAIGVQLAPEDIASFGTALFRHHTERINELEKISQNYRDKGTELQRTIRKLERALTKISNLIESHSDDEPSTELLLQNLKKIADHYRRNSTRDNTLELEGVKPDEN